MTDLILLIVTAAAAYGVANGLRVPVIPLLILPGMVLSFVSGGLHTTFEITPNALELGLTFLVFATGIELNVQRFKPQFRAVIWVGLLQFLVVGLLGFSTALLLGLDRLFALYIGLGLSTSSTLVVLRHLKQQQQMFEPFGRLVTGVLLLQDLLMIAMILVVSRLLDGTAVMMQSIGLTVLLVGLAVVLQRWWVPLLVSRLKLDEETFLLCILAVLFAFIGTAFYLSLPLVVGAFCAGFAFSTFPVNGLVRGLVSSLSDFFMAVFFLALGAFVILPSPEYLLNGLILVLLMILMTPPLVTCIAEWTGLSSRASIESGLLLAQMSEYSLVLGLIGLLAGHINLEMFSTLALMVVLTMTLTPLLATDRVTRRLLHLHPLRRRAKADAQFQDHVLVLGFGAGGMWVVKPLIKEGHPILVVDDDPVVIEQLRKNNIPCIRGDGSDEKNLEKSGARRAKLIIASMRRVQDAEKVIRYARGVPVIVRVLETKEAEQVKSLGGNPILNSEAAADTFLEWYEKSGRVQPASPVKT